MRAPSFPQRACPREALGRESSLRTRPLTLDPRLRRGDVVRGVARCWENAVRG
jgi:hypothetical protein